MKDKESLEDVLGIQDTMKEIELEDVDTSSKGSTNDAGLDYEFLRGKILTAIIRSSETLDEAVRVSKAYPPTAKMVESIAKVLSSIADSSERLLNVHDKIRELQKDESKDVKDEKPKAMLKDVIEMAKYKTGTKE